MDVLIQHTKNTKILLILGPAFVPYIVDRTHEHMKRHYKEMLYHPGVDDNCGNVLDRLLFCSFCSRLCLWLLNAVLLLHTLGAVLSQFQGGYGSASLWQLEYIALHPVLLGLSFYLTESEDQLEVFVKSFTNFRMHKVYEIYKMVEFVANGSKFRGFA